MTAPALGSGSASTTHCCFEPSEPDLDSAPARTKHIKPCLKSSCLRVCPDTANTAHGLQRHVEFNDDTLEEVHPADVWDRTPTEPTRKLSYQDLLELKEIQRSLPLAHQLNGPLLAKPTYLSSVPIPLLPLLPTPDASHSPASSQTSSASASPRESPPLPTVHLHNHNYNPIERPPPAPSIRPSTTPFVPRFAQAQTHTLALPPRTQSIPNMKLNPVLNNGWSPAHLAHLIPSRPANPRPKPGFAFVPLLDSPPGSLSSSRSGSPPHQPLPTSSLSSSNLFASPPPSTSPSPAPSPSHPNLPSLPFHASSPGRTNLKDQQQQISGKVKGEIPPNFIVSPRARMATTILFPEADLHSDDADADPPTPSLTNASLDESCSSSSGSGSDCESWWLCANANNGCTIDTCECSPRSRPGSVDEDCGCSCCACSGSCSSPDDEEREMELERKNLNLTKAQSDNGKHDVTGSTIPPLSLLLFGDEWEEEGPGLEGSNDIHSEFHYNQHAHLHSHHHHQQPRKHRHSHTCTCTCTAYHAHVHSHPNLNLNSHPHFLKEKETTPTTKNVMFINGEKVDLGLVDDDDENDFGGAADARNSVRRQLQSRLSHNIVGNSVDVGADGNCYDKKKTKKERKRNVIVVNDVEIDLGDEDDNDDDENDEVKEGYGGHEFHEGEGDHGHGHEHGLDLNLDLDLGDLARLVDDDKSEDEDKRESGATARRARFSVEHDEVEFEDEDGMDTPLAVSPEVFIVGAGGEPSSILAASPPLESQSQSQSVQLETLNGVPFCPELRLPPPADSASVVASQERQTEESLKSFYSHLSFGSDLDSTTTIAAVTCSTILTETFLNAPATSNETVENVTGNASISARINATENGTEPDVDVLSGTQSESESGSIVTTTMMETTKASSGVVVIQNVVAVAVAIVVVVLGRWFLA